jgi:hypothetical protein
MRMRAREQGEGLGELGYRGLLRSFVAGYASGAAVQAQAVTASAALGKEDIQRKPPVADARRLSAATFVRREQDTCVDESFSLVRTPGTVGHHVADVAAGRISILPCRDRLDRLDAGITLNPHALVGAE